MYIVVQPTKLTPVTGFLSTKQRMQSKLAYANTSNCYVEAIFGRFIKLNIVNVLLLS